MLIQTIITLTGPHRDRLMHRDRREVFIITLTGSYRGRGGVEGTRTELQNYNMMLQEKNILLWAAPCFPPFC